MSFSLKESMENKLKLWFYNTELLISFLNKLKGLGIQDNCRGERVFSVFRAVM